MTQRIVPSNYARNVGKLCQLKKGEAVYDINAMWNISRELKNLLDRVSTIEEFYNVTMFFMETGDNFGLGKREIESLVSAWKMAGVRFGSPNSLDVLEEVINRMGKNGNEVVALLSRRVDTLGFPRRIENVLVHDCRSYLWQLFPDCGFSAQANEIFGISHRSREKIVRERLYEIGLEDWWLAFFAADLPHQQTITTEDDLKKHGVYLGPMGEGTYMKYLRLARRAVGKRAVLGCCPGGGEYLWRPSGLSNWQKIADWEGAKEFSIFAVNSDKYFVYHYGYSLNYHGRNDPRPRQRHRR